MSTVPLLPDTDDPDPRKRAPLLPRLALPVLITIAPLVPCEPDDAVRSSRLPLLVDEPRPVVISTLPPDADLERPAETIIWPPIPLSPAPTVRYNDPPLPDVADPEPTRRTPLFPFVAEPLLNTSEPLTPEEPAEAVLKSNTPLLVAVLKPVTRDIRPPLEEDDAPADKTI